MTVRQVLKIPLDLASIFTGSKAFVGNSILGSKLLNRMGLHVLRVLLAHGVMWLRWLVLTPLMPSPLRRTFHRDGFVVIEDFLSAEACDALIRDANSLDAAPRQLAQGDTFTQRILLRPSVADHLDSFRALVHNPRLARYIGYAGGRWRRPLLYLQRIRNSARTGEADPQKTLHSDTFHPTVKAWLFLEDVPLAKGPFSYVPGSHRLTRKRLAWEYAISTAPTRDGYTAKGSLRASEADLKAMGLTAPRAVTARRGTLVIANTNGFHRRGEAESGASRMEIWAYSRHNPFNPWPGLGSGISTWLEEQILERLWHMRDKKAERAGKRASWHKIALKDMLDDDAQAL